ncbi:hypothetical protein [Vibrio phage VpV262]|uniref:Uncharacterized protein n=1 Tax=Vibrio phage VpV262 TaxID=2907796 RepID=Q8LT98_9CAUD|nr:hypothetical protein VpV262p01 [Vibrio phage VpV262]AAM28349.1 hypothetical protein [Vibrio phage VpV262]
MKALALKTVQSNIRSIVRNSNPAHLQEVFASTIWHGLIHSNIMPAAMKALRDSDAPSKLKAGISKYMPMKWDKKREAYVFNAAKREKLLSDLALTDESSFEDLANSLPQLFEKKSEPTAYSRDAYLANVAKKLEKEGEQNVQDIIGLVSAMLDNPELVSAAAKAVFKQTAAKAA